MSINPIMCIDTGSSACFWILSSTISVNQQRHLIKQTSPNPGPLEKDGMRNSGGILLILQRHFRENGQKPEGEPTINLFLSSGVMTPGLFQLF
jgi:hypothetical protein